MSRTYVIADLHGRMDLFRMALSTIGTDPPGTLVLLGDYVDRGPDSRGLINDIASLQSTRLNGRWIIVAVKGNHDDMLVETVRDGLDTDYWFSNGGAATVQSYGKDPQPGAMMKDVIPEDHVNWLAKLPTSYQDKHRLYVHAGANSDFELRDQQHTLLWHRYPAGDDHTYRGKHIVHGHTPNTKGPILLKNRTNLDTLAWRTGRLVVGVFDDDVPGGPVDFIEIVGRPYCMVLGDYE